MLFQVFFLFILNALSPLHLLDELEIHKDYRHIWTQEQECDRNTLLESLSLYLHFQAIKLLLHLLF